MVARGRAGNAQKKMLDEEKAMNEEQLKALQKQLTDAQAALAVMTADRDTLAGKVTALEAARLTDEAGRGSIEDGIKKRLESFGAGGCHRPREEVRTGDERHRRDERQGHSNRCH